MLWQREMKRFKQPETLAEATEQIEKLYEITNYYAGQLRSLKRQIYGQKSEKRAYLSAKQEAMFASLDSEIFSYQTLLHSFLDENDEETSQSTSPLSSNDDNQVKNTENDNSKAQSSSCLSRKKKRPQTYETLLEKIKDLPRESVHYEIIEGQCSCCEKPNLVELREDISYRVDIKPIECYVIEEHRHYYKCKECQKFVGAPKPISSNAGSLPGNHLLVDLIYKHFEMCTPYYRMERYLSSIGIPISRANMCNWLNNLAQGDLKMLYREIVADVLSNEVIKADETTFKEQDAQRCATRYLWGFTGGQTKSVFYVYGRRNSLIPSNLLKSKNIKYLGVDKYAGYNKAIRENHLIVSYCWAHLRRQFADILLRLSDPPIFVSQTIQKINAILIKDKDIREKAKEEIVKRREEEVRPLVDSCFAMLRDYLENNKLLPKDMKDAIMYALKDEDGFKTFLLHADLEPTNNESERNMRGIAILRKNVMFAGNALGGEAIAIFLTIVKSALANGLNIIKYLKHVLDKITNMKANKIKELLPQNCPQFKLLH